MKHADFPQVLLTIQMDYVEMPNLKLTVGEAAVLWTLPIDVCQAAVRALVAAGFLVETDDGNYLRRGTPPVHVEYLAPLTWVTGRFPWTRSRIH